MFPELHTEFCDVVEVLPSVRELFEEGGEGWREGGLLLLDDEEGVREDGEFGGFVEA